MANKQIASKQNNNSVMLRAEMMHSGPIPDATQLERYERICAGAADRIITMAEKQAEHRQEIEKIVVTANAKNSTWGVVFAFILGFVTIIGGIILGCFGRELSGAILGSAGLIGLVGVFIYGTRSSRREREEKNKIQKQ